MTQQEMDVSVVVPTPATNCPHVEEYESVEDNLIAHASHMHPSYMDDNTKVYYYLEETTCGTMYVALLGPQQHAKDGQAALFSFHNQYAGHDKWELELTKQDDLLHNSSRRGQSSYLLEKFISQHCNAFILMQQCAQHVSYQLPNKCTHLGYLLNVIETSDASLQVAMAQICTDGTPPNGLCHNFERAATFLWP